MNPQNGCYILRLGGGYPSPELTPKTPGPVASADIVSMCLSACLPNLCYIPATLAA